mmetsp:Transcript_1833/g.4316  ORF Transcript_1833/g.4316 Transcript_1833/m.4316 type:complete len:158 (+) Transcript_1833:248-721(+)
MAQKMQSPRAVGLFLVILCGISVVLYTKGAPKFHDSPYQFYYQQLRNGPLRNMTVPPHITHLADSVHSFTSAAVARVQEPLDSAVSYGMRSLNISSLDDSIPPEWNDSLRNITRHTHRVVSGVAEDVQDWAEDVQDWAGDWWGGDRAADNQTAAKTA